MQKPGSGSLKKALQVSNNFFHHCRYISLFLFITCFSFIPGNSIAQTHKSLDLRTEIELSEDRKEGPTEFFQFISNSTNYVSLGIPTTFLVKGILSHDKIARKKSLYMFESLGISSAITFAVKYTFKRKRPFDASPLVIKASGGGGPSFPSGHTSEAFSAATSLSIAYPKWYVIAPAFVWASTVGYSRMYLGVHYPSDVLAGAIVGAGSAFLSYKINKWMQSDRKKKRIIANPY